MFVNIILRIRTRRNNLDTNIERYYSILKELLKIGDKSYFLMKSSSSFYKKRLILNLIISNCFIEGKNIVISIITPLETILNFKGCPTWLAILDEIREKDRENVLSQTEALKQLDMKEMEEISKHNYFVYK